MIDSFAYVPDMRERRERVKANHPQAWGYGEEQTLVKMYKQGYTVDIIGGYLPNRTQAAIGAKLRKMKQRGEI